MFQTEEGKLRDLGMVFKPSFKCFKNEKINFIPAFLKLETLLYQNIYILFHLILYLQSDFDSKFAERFWLYFILMCNLIMPPSEFWIWTSLCKTIEKMHIRITRKWASLFFRAKLLWLKNIIIELEFDEGNIPYIDMM